MLDGIALDLRFLLRTLRRSPGFTLVVVLTLALGIGVTTAIVSVVDHVLVRSLPFDDAGRLTMMLEQDEHKGFRTPSNPTAVDWGNDPLTSQVFEGVTYARGDGVQVCEKNTCVSRGGAYVKADFFPLLRPRLTLGRVLIPSDQNSAARVVVISNRLWKKTFNGDSQVVGRSILVDSIPTTVVGVLAPGAVYPPFADTWQPVSAYRHADVLERRGNHADSRTMGRLRPGVDSARAAQVMSTIGARLAAAYPAEQAHWMPAMISVQTELVGGIRPMLWTFGAAALAVLLLACANVAGLLLARMMTRGRELALRAAIGASRRRVIRQLFTESLFIAALGGALGVTFALIGLRLSHQFLLQQLPRADELGVDWRVLSIAAGATICTALICGVWPAVTATRPSAGSPLRASASGAVGASHAARVRRLLVTTQFAIALMLLVCSGLLIQSFRRASRVELGFEPRGLVSVRINPPKSYVQPQQLAVLYQRLIDAAQATTGVSDAAFINHSPFSGAAITTTFAVEGRAALDSSNQIFYRTVSASYLRTMKMTMRAGRWFNDDDMRSPDGVYVINETTAKRYWPSGSAVGQHITVARAAQNRKDFGTPEPGVVIGVIADVHQTAQDVAPDAEVYVPFTHEPWGWGMLIARANAGSTPALAKAIRSVDPALLAAGAEGEAAFGEMQSAVESRLKPRRLSIKLIGTFAVASLLLACLGLYGLMAYTVAQRTREIGVRKALGATDGRLVLLIMRESSVMIGGGAVVGIIGAIAGARLIRGLLFETGSLDVGAYLTAVVVLAAVAALATLLPARRAARLDPATALRD